MLSAGSGPGRFGTPGHNPPLGGIGPMNHRATLAVLGSLTIGVLLGRIEGPGPRRAEAASDQNHEAKAGAASSTPLDGIHLHLCAFHIAKKDPTFQLEAQ